jgi:hypothetical protein
MVFEEVLLGLGAVALSYLVGGTAFVLLGLVVHVFTTGF